MKRLLLSLLLLSTSLGGMAQRPGGATTLAASGGGDTPLPSGPSLYEPALQQNPGELPRQVAAHFAPLPSQPPAHQRAAFAPNTGIA